MEKNRLKRRINRFLWNDAPRGSWLDYLRYLFRRDLSGVEGVIKGFWYSDTEYIKAIPYRVIRRNSQGRDLWDIYCKDSTATLGSMTGRTLRQGEMKP